MGPTTNQEALQHATAQGHAGAVRVLAARREAEQIRRMRDSVDYAAEYRAKFGKPSKAEDFLHGLAFDLAGADIVVLPGRRYLAEVGQEINFRRMLR